MGILYHQKPEKLTHYFKQKSFEVFIDIDGHICFMDNRPELRDSYTLFVKNEEVLKCTFGTFDKLDIEYILNLAKREHGFENEEYEHYSTINEDIAVSTLKKGSCILNIYHSKTDFFTATKISMFKNLNEGEFTVTIGAPV